MSFRYYGYLWYPIPDTNSTSDMPLSQRTNYRRISNVICHYRCVEIAVNDNIDDAGRDNRKSAAAGAKDGQFSDGFVTRESLHGGQ